jgi:hypothetical protein
MFMPETHQLDFFWTYLNNSALQYLFSNVNIAVSLDYKENCASIENYTCL